MARKGVPPPSHLTFFSGRLDLRNVLIVAGCIEIACVITGFLVYNWQQREMVQKIETERIAAYEESNGYMAEILRLRKLLAAKGIDARIGAR